MPDTESMAMQSGQEMMQPVRAEMREPARMGMSQGGHLYTQTNETHNCIIHYLRSPEGTIKESERSLTGGPGTGGYNPTVDAQSTPNDFEGARSVILSPDHRFLFTTNAGDNSVSSFAVGDDGGLTLIDAKRTGNVVSGAKTGSAKSLAYDESTGTLYVLHALGPDHLRLMSVDSEGRLAPRPERYTANTPDKSDRVATMVMLSPDAKFLIVGTTFDERATHYPDGSPILWKEREDGQLHLIASNAPDPDGLVVFPVNPHGTLGEPILQDGGGASPWFPLFLNHRPNQFLIGYAVEDGVSLATLDSDGKVSTGPVVQADTTNGRPTELCWLSITPDDRLVFGTMFGYGYLSSWRLEGNVLTIAKDPACPRVPGDGTYRALNGDVSSGPSDSWISPNGDYLYQIYGNASKLIGYSISPDGSLEEITSAEIPYNSPQGLAGF